MDLKSELGGQVHRFSVYGPAIWWVAKLIYEWYKYCLMNIIVGTYGRQLMWICYEIHHNLRWICSLLYVHCRHCFTFHLWCLKTLVLTGNAHTKWQKSKQHIPLSFSKEAQLLHSSSAASCIQFSFFCKVLLVLPNQD